MSAIPSPTPTRRTVLASALGAAAVAWTRIGVVDRAEAAEADLPTGFPAGLDLHRAVFRSWDGTIVTDSLWTTTLRSPADAVAATRWAARAGYRLRPRGNGHTWSPLVTANGTDASARVVIVDMTAMTAMSMVGTDRLRVQAGAFMDKVMAFLSANGRSLMDIPAPGDVTVGGVLAIGGHGTGLPRAGERRPDKATYGTVSNLVVELTAVVHDPATGDYALKTFHRDDPAIAPLLTSTGRTLITEVVLQTAANYMLRVRNTTSIHWSTLFARPDLAGPLSLSRLVEQHGRVGLIWFAMTDFPWVQTWETCPTKPLLSRRVTAPYQYSFADTLDEKTAATINDITRGSWALAPVATNAQLAAASAGLAATGCLDMWGEAKNFLNFVRPTTLKVCAGSHAVIARRADIQRVVHEFTSFYQGLIARYALAGRYPANNVCEIRITGIDDPADIGVPGAVAPALSAASPVPGRPELDTAIWLDVLVLPGTKDANAFFAEIDAWFRAVPSDLGVARPEWAKRFGHTAAGPWTDRTHLTEWLPGQVPGWHDTVAALDALDPAGVFRAPLHDVIMPRG